MIDRLLGGVIKTDKPWEWVALAVVVLMLVGSAIISGYAVVI